MLIVTSVRPLRVDTYTISPPVTFHVISPKEVIRRLQLAGDILVFQCVSTFVMDAIPFCQGSGNLYSPFPLPPLFFFPFFPMIFLWTSVFTTSPHLTFTLKVFTPGPSDGFLIRSTTCPSFNFDSFQSLFPTGVSLRSRVRLTNVCPLFSSGFFYLPLPRCFENFG